ncbi:MAG TPA: T9SS type A sorting domain-containing protein, partial [Paludibacteraceae bacterium]|nr:T9SS type A sorting domain-containing protein [Paludibacteraceae bacterium]
NPLEGNTLNIRIKNNDAKLLQAQLFHLNGQCVASQQLNPMNGIATFKIGKLPAGNYFLKIINKETSETINLLIK